MPNSKVMEVTDLLKRANNSNIIVLRAENNLKIQFKKNEKIDECLLQELRKNKESILEYLKMIQGDGISKGSFLKNITLPSLTLKRKKYYDVMHQQKKEYLRFLIAGKNMSNLRFTLRYQFLDREILERAINSVFKRHESLRTTFLKVKGVVKQAIHRYKTNESKIEYINLSGGYEQERLAEIDHNLGKISFDFEKGPLVNIKVIDLPDGASVLVFTIHHAICDAGSMELLKKEINVLYDAYKKNGKNPLPSLKIQYKDYGFWINGLLESREAMEYKYLYIKRISESLSKENDINLNGRKRSYKEELQREMKMILKTEDHSEYSEAFGTIVTLMPGSGASYTAFIAGPLSDKLKNLAVRCNSSLFVTLLASFAILFYKRDKKKNIRISIPFSTRVFEELEDIVGWLTHNLIICIDINDKLNVEEFVGTVTNIVWESADFCLFPHEKIMEELDLPLNVLAPVYMNFFKTTDESINDLTPAHSDKGSGLLDLKCIACECKNGIALKLNYNIGKYSRNEIELVSKEYLTTLESMTNNSKRLLRNL